VCTWSSWLGRGRRAQVLARTAGDPRDEAGEGALVLRIDEKVERVEDHDRRAWSRPASASAKFYEREADLEDSSCVSPEGRAMARLAERLDAALTPDGQEHIRASATAW